MPSDILVDNLGLTYKTNFGVSTATLPDVCKTPSPGGDTYSLPKFCRPKFA